MPATKTIALNTLRQNPANPNIMSERAYTTLLRSLYRDLTFLESMPLKYAGGVWWCGNQRSRALEHLVQDPKWVKKMCRIYGDIPPGHIPACWTMSIARRQDGTKRTDAEIRRIALLDNSPPGISGTPDWDMLADLPEWDIEELQEWGLSPVVFGDESNTFNQETVNNKAKEGEKTCPHCGKPL